jgi:hypothetical protein
MKKKNVIKSIKKQLGNTQKTKYAIKIVLQSTKL